MLSFFIPDEIVFWVTTICVKIIPELFWEEIGNHGVVYDPAPTPEIKPQGRTRIEDEEPQIETQSWYNLISARNFQIKQPD